MSNNNLLARPVLWAGVVLLSTASLFAQGILSSPELRIRDEWYEDDTSNYVFERAVVGRFGANIDKDMVVLRQKDSVRQAVYLPDIERFQVPTVLGSAVDIAMLPAQAQNGHDTLLVVDGTTIRLFEQGSNNQLTSTSIPSPQIERVWVVHKSSGESWVLGADVSGTVLHRFQWDGQDLLPTGSSQIPVTPSDIQSLEWDGDPETSELALLFVGTTGAFALVTDFDMVSPAARYVPLPVPGPGVAAPQIAVSRSPELTDMLCVYSHVVNLDYLLLSMREGFADEVTYLPGVVAIDMSAVDGNGDGHDDVIFTTEAVTGESYLACAMRSGSSMQFSLDGPELLRPESTDPFAAQTVVWNDIDRDGDHDAIAFDGSAMSLVTLISDVAPSRRVGLIGPAEEDIGWLLEGASNLPFQVVAPSGIPLDGSYEILVEVWFHDEPGAFGNQRIHMVREPLLLGTQEVVLDIPNLGPFDQQYAADVHVRLFRELGADDEYLPSHMIKFWHLGPPPEIYLGGGDGTTTGTRTGSRPPPLPPMPTGG